MGYWVCTGLDIGEQLDQEGIRSLLGVDASEVLSLHLSSDGQAEIVVFDERFSGSWAEGENGGKVTISGEDSPLMLALRENGTAWIIYFGEAAAGVWEETEDGIDLHLTGGAGLDLSFYLWPDGTLE